MVCVPIETDHKRTLDRRFKLWKCTTMSKQSLRTIDVLPILWVAFCAIFSGGARITSGRGGVIFTACIMWIGLRYFGVIA